MAVLDLGRDTSGRPLRLDDTTAARLRWAENRLGIKLVVVQGSYVKGTSASAGTHDGGGVLDIRSRDFTPETRHKVLVALREAGLIAWYRTKAQGFDPHIHAVELASTTLAPSARNQVTAYRKGRNGLKGNGPDDGPDVVIPIAVPTDHTTGTTPTEEDDMTPDQDAMLKRLDSRMLTLMKPIEEIHTLVRGIADVVRNMSRWVGYLMPAVERQGVSLTALAAQVEDALAATTDPTLVARLEEIRTGLDDAIKSASR